MDDQALLHALGDELRFWRKRRKLTRDALAAMAGISPTTLGRIERDGPTSVGDTWGLARALDIPFHELIRRAEEAAELSGGPVSAGADRSEDAIAADQQKSSIAGEQEQPTEP